MFPFFADENNLERITPPWLNFKVLGKSTPTLKQGTYIDYQLKLRGVPLRWQSLIETWNPEERVFVDTQVKGPYSLWHHTHRFQEAGNRTLMIDEVRYRLPGGRLGNLVAGAWVAKDLQKIFGYRRAQIDQLFSKEVAGKK